MQRELRAERAWRHWTGRVLPVLAVALLAAGPLHAKDKKKKREAEVPAKVESQALYERPAVNRSEDARPPPAQAEGPALYERPTVIRPEGARPPPAQMMREAPRPAQRVSIDRVIEQVERRYKAKVVSYKKTQKGDQLIYELRLLSDEGRVSNVKVDAETGKEI
jgi:uncharacterized membrane protein YkoI